MEWLMENSPRIICLLGLSINLSILGFFAFTPPCEKPRKPDKPKLEKTGFKILAWLGGLITMGLSGLFGLSGLSGLFGFTCLDRVGWFFEKATNRNQKPENRKNYTSHTARLKKEV